MLPESIPTSYIITASALLSGFIAYQSRKNGLETQWERERFIDHRMAGSRFVSDDWAIRFERVHIIEEDGLWYRFMKFMTGRMAGEADVQVQYEGIPIPGEFWESDDGERVLGMVDAPIEHVETYDQLNPPAARFRVHSVEYDDIAGAFSSLIKIDEYGREQQAQ